MVRTGWRVVQKKIVQSKFHLEFQSIEKDVQRGSNFVFDGEPSLFFQ